MYSWGNAKRYNDYSSYIKNTFGQRVQKISVNAGFTCPNRDGVKGIGGCTFCNNSTFSPAYSDADKTVTAQIDKGISFFRPKYQAQHYLAYFQSYSNTYGETEHLLKLYREALDHPLVTGIVLGTRPDCLADELLDTLAQWNKKHYVAIELGAESTLNHTLEQINRGHTWEETVEGVRRIKQRGIPVGMHLILGLPGESRSDMLNHADIISETNIDFLKLHQLQIVKGSEYGRKYRQNPDFFQLFSADEFVDLVIGFIERTHPAIVLERFISQAPYNLLIAPDWGIKNFEFVAKVEKELQARNTWQGRLCQIAPEVPLEHCSGPIVNF